MNIKFTINGPSDASFSELPNELLNFVFALPEMDPFNDNDKQRKAEDKLPLPASWKKGAKNLDSSGSETAESLLLFDDAFLASASVNSVKLDLSQQMIVVEYRNGEIEDFDMPIPTQDRDLQSYLQQTLTSLLLAYEILTENYGQDLVNAVLCGDTSEFDDIAEHPVEETDDEDCDLEDRDQNYRDEQASNIFAIHESIDEIHAAMQPVIGRIQEFFILPLVRTRTADFALWHLEAALEHVKEKLRDQSGLFARVILKSIEPKQIQSKVNKKLLDWANLAICRYKSDKKDDDSARSSFGLLNANGSVAIDLDRLKIDPNNDNEPSSASSDPPGSISSTVSSTSTSDDAYNHFEYLGVNSLPILPPVPPQPFIHNMSSAHRNEYKRLMTKIAPLKNKEVNILTKLAALQRTVEKRAVLYEKEIYLVESPKVEKLDRPSVAEGISDDSDSKKAPMTSAAYDKSVTDFAKHYATLKKEETLFNQTSQTFLPDAALMISLNQKKRPNELASLQLLKHQSRKFRKQRREICAEIVKKKAEEEAKIKPVGKREALQAMRLNRTESYMDLSKIDEDFKIEDDDIDKSDSDSDDSDSDSDEDEPDTDREEPDIIINPDEIDELEETPDDFDAFLLLQAAKSAHDFNERSSSVEDDSDLSVLYYTEQYGDENMPPIVENEDGTYDIVMG